jgi:hypothetical protein
MATRRSSKTPEPPPPKDWTLAAITRGIQKLQLRIRDLDELAGANVSYKDPRVDPLESEIAATIEDVFGTGSRENRENSYVRIYHSGPTRRAAFNEPRQLIEQRSQEYFSMGVDEVREKLRGLIKRLEEKMDDFRRCPKCNWTFRNEDYCTQDGSPLVALSYNPDAPTLRDE